MVIQKGEGGGAPEVFILKHDLIVLYQKPKVCNLIQCSFIFFKKNFYFEQNSRASTLILEADILPNMVLNTIEKLAKT